MLTKTQETILSDLYEIHPAQLGWLTHIDDLICLTAEETAWLKWRDDQQALVDNTLKAWEREIAVSGSWSIYNEAEDGEKLRLLNRRISEIEKEADDFTGDSRYVFMGLSDLSKLEKLRHKVRGRLIHQVFVEAIDELPEWLICQAREVPLQDIVEHLPRNRFIRCPFHRENTPSFLVGQWGYCFGCGVWCDAIKWCITQREMSFIESVKYLANLGE